MAVSEQTGAGRRAPIKKLRWWIGGLLFASTVINYIDRQTLSRGWAAGQRPVDVVEGADGRHPGQRGRGQGHGHRHLQVGVHDVRPITPDPADENA